MAPSAARGEPAEAAARRVTGLLRVAGCGDLEAYGLIVLVDDPAVIDAAALPIGVPAFRLRDLAEDLPILPTRNQLDSDDVQRAVDALLASVDLETRLAALGRAGARRQRGRARVE
jgi:hypothetical protein